MLPPQARARLKTRAAYRQSPERFLRAGSGQAGTGTLTATGPVTVPQDTANISIKLLSNPYTKPSSFMKAQYAILADGLPVAEHTSYFKAQLLQDVWVAQQVAQRGVTLEEAKITKTKTNIINLRDAIWTANRQHLQLVSTLSPGVVLQERHLRRTPAVFRNQTVDAVLIHKSLVIRLRVIALEDGAWP